MAPPTPAQRFIGIVAAFLLGIPGTEQHAGGRETFQPDCQKCEGVFTIEGQRLYLEKIGDRGPYVVLEAGLGDSSTSWQTITRTLSEFSQVILYDRAGLGRSTPRSIDTDTPITANQAVTTLHSLLQKADIRPPYILVGHSLGGLYMQLFARKYPDAVRGIVLIDSTSSNEPDHVFVSQAKLTPGSVEFLENAGLSESKRQVRNAGPFPDLPLAVITATDHGPRFRASERWWMELQRGLASASPQASI